MKALKVLIFALASIGVALFILASTDDDFLVRFLIDLKWLGVFVTGIGFTTLLTTGPASALFIEMSDAFSPWVMALWGGLGAMVGDSLLLSAAHRALPMKRVTRWLHRPPCSPVTHALLWVLGAMVIASPLPDELGVAVLGVAKLARWQFLLLAFVGNAIGIFLIAGIARAV